MIVINYGYYYLYSNEIENTFTGKFFVATKQLNP